MSETPLTRTDLLRGAGAAAAGLAFAGPMRFGREALKGSLTVVQWNHVVSAYDTWLDRWAKDWGERNDVKVTMDHVDYVRLPALAAAEAKAQKGHDVFGFRMPPASYAPQVIDHTPIVRQVESVVGAYGELGKRSTYDARTKTYFGVADHFVPAPLLWRHDLWNAAGESPATWDRVLAAAPTLRAEGHPVGIGQSQALESQLTLLGFMLCFGSSLQDASNAPALDVKKTVEAVRFMADLFRTGEDSHVVSWSDASNNAFLASGRGSLILNAVSAVQLADDLTLPFAKDLWLWPIPAGPAARIGLPQATGVYSIWKFAKNRETAERFLAELCLQAEDASVASRLFNLPTFPGAFPASRLYRAASAQTTPPRGKYTILATVGAKHTRNVGYPGYANAAVEEALERGLVARMFSSVSLGTATPEEAVRQAAREVNAVWAKWKAAGRL